MKQAYGLSIPQTLEDIVQPSRCGLIVYDMQSGIVPQIPSGLEIRDRCASILSAARKAGFRVFHTRHFFLPRSAAGLLSCGEQWYGSGKMSHRRPLASFHKDHLRFRSFRSLHLQKAR